MSQQRIQDWYEHWNGNVYVSRSGGEDSDVLGHMVEEMYPDVPQVFVNTGLEHDSVRIHGEDAADIILKPQMNFVDVITKYGYPIISKEVAQILYEVQKRKLEGKDPASYRMNKLLGQATDKNTGKPSSYNIPQYKFLIDAPF